MILSVVLFLLALGYVGTEVITPTSVHYTASSEGAVTEISKKEEPKPSLPPLDKELYDKKLVALANYPLETSPTATSSTPKKRIWPPQRQYPTDGALLPFRRVIAYYGNFYSTKMGALGEYAPDEMLARLQAEVKAWNDADPETPVIPAIHYIAVTAQGAPGEEGKYRLRMPDSEIEKAIALAEKVDGIVFLDLQIGLSSFEEEIPRLEKYLKLPHVHLGLDPEFSMKTGARPGKVIGTMDAADINYAQQYLAKLVTDNHLPPKILVIHRFTQRMITNYQQINDVPEVQIVIHMDGWGSPASKINTYRNFVYPEPVEFTGFKLFYKNDLRNPPKQMLTPQELLKLTPRPIYIQYQ